MWYNLHESRLVWGDILRRWRSRGRHLSYEGKLCRQARVCIKWWLVIGEETRLGKAGTFSSESDSKWCCLTVLLLLFKGNHKARPLACFGLICSVHLQCLTEVMITNGHWALTVPKCCVGVISFGLQSNNGCCHVLHYCHHFRGKDCTSQDELGYAM